MFSLTPFFKSFRHIDISRMTTNNVINKIQLEYSNVNPAIVLGLNFNGLGIIRSLSGLKIPLIGIYSNDFEIGRHSKYCMALYFPLLANDPECFKNKLIQLGKKLNKKSVLLPQNDEYVKFISDNRIELEEYFLFQIPSKKLLDNIINKQEAEDIAQQNGLNVPKSIIPKKDTDIKGLDKKLKFPLIIKSYDSFSQKFSGRRKVVDNNSELISFFNDHPELIGDTIVQEVNGKGDGYIFQCQTYYNLNSEPLAFFTVKKVRQYPPDFGVGSYVKSEINNDIIKLSKKFLKKIKYKGAASLEFIYLKDEKKYVFVELNPRYPGHISFCTADGINFPYITYCDLVEINHKYQTPKQLQRKNFLWVECDLRSYYKRLSQGNPPNFFSWVMTYLASNSYLYFSKNDIMPFIFRLSIYRWFMRLLKKGKLLIKSI